MAERPLKTLALILALAASFAATPAFAVADNDELTAQERISSNDLYKLMRDVPGVVVFDARGKRDYDALHIEGATLPLPLQYYNDAELFKEGVLPKAPDMESSLAESMKAYPKGTRIVTYCNRDCPAAARLLRILNRFGFTNVQAMEEGVQAWQELGYPSVAGA
jgi:rhodanese-related sulfurtransferase